MFPLRSKVSGSPKIVRFLFDVLLNWVFCIELGQQFRCESFRARQSDPEPLVFMVLDVLEEAGGRFNIWGKSNGGESVLVRINDFTPYFYMAQPTHADYEPRQNGQPALFHQAACDHLQQAVNR